MTPLLEQSLSPKAELTEKPPSKKQVRFNLNICVVIPATEQQVHFDLENTLVQEIPSLDQYNIIDLYRLHYRQSDYEYFQRTYQEEEEHDLPSDSLIFLTWKHTKPRAYHQLEHDGKRQKVQCCNSDRSETPRKRSSFQV